MKEITNKHLLTAIIVIGVIITALLIPLYGNGVSSPYAYSYGNTFNANTLGATAYNADYSGSPTGSFLNLGSRQPYQAVINKSYYPESYNSSYGSSSDSYYYYTTTGSTTYDTSYYNDNQGYTPPGCEGGTDYSTTTNEPCG